MQHTSGVRCGNVTVDKRSMRHGGRRSAARGELRRRQRLAQEFGQGAKREVGLLLGQPGSADAGRADHCMATCWKNKRGGGLGWLRGETRFRPKRLGT
jgi:hypothetical protein